MVNEFRLLVQGPIIRLCHPASFRERNPADWFDRGRATDLGTATDYLGLIPANSDSNFADNLTWTMGRHTIEVRCGRFKQFRTISTSSGTGPERIPTRRWVELALDFLRQYDRLKRWRVLSRRPVGNPILDFRTTDYSVFAQDQFEPRTSSL